MLAAGKRLYTDIREAKIKGASERMLRAGLQRPPLPDAGSVVGEAAFGSGIFVVRSPPTPHPTL